MHIVNNGSLRYKRLSLFIWFLRPCTLTSASCASCLPPYARLMDQFVHISSGNLRFFSGFSAPSSPSLVRRGAAGPVMHFLSRSLADQRDNAKRSSQAAATEEEEDDDWSNDDTSTEHLVNYKEIGEGINQDDHHADASDEDYMKPQPRKERIRKCLAKLKKGPDGRFINVLEVTSDINMLIAAYQNLKAQSRPTYLIENSDDEDSMEGINIQRFKKLQKRLRSGTYRFGKEPKKK